MSDICVICLELKLQEGHGMFQTLQIRQCTVTEQLRRLSWFQERTRSVLGLGEGRVFEWLPASTFFHFPFLSIFQQMAGFISHETVRVFWLHQTEAKTGGLLLQWTRYRWFQRRYSQPTWLLQNTIQPSQPMTWLTLTKLNITMNNTKHSNILTVYNTNKISPFNEIKIWSWVLYVIQPTNRLDPETANVTKHQTSQFLPIPFHCLSPALIPPQKGRVAAMFFNLYSYSGRCLVSDFENPFKMQLYLS